jgi:hypothetical protein
MINSSLQKTIEAPVELSRLQKILAVLLGAFLMGALWRIRGEHGFGCSWGLLTVAIVFLLFVYAIFGFRRKINFLLYSFTAFSFMLTVPGWGTLNHQITGVLGSAIPGGQSVFISPFSGVFMMLCLGFSLSAVFAFMLGRFFSDRQYNFKDIIILLAVFWGVGLIAKLSVSHLILDLVQPQAGDLFSQGMQNANIAGTPWQVYLQHFFDNSWAKPLAGGRNYFTSINTISAALAALALGLTVRYGFKDKVAGRITLGICAAFAFAITVADLSLFISGGGYHGEHDYAFLEKISGWCVWEYFTGFLAGGIIMHIFVTQPFSRLSASANVEEPLTSNMSNKLYSVLNFIFTFILCFSAAFIRPIAGRYDESEAYLPIYIILSVIFLAVAILVIYKKGAALKEINFRRFSTYALPVTFVANLLIYFFTGTKDIQNFRNADDIANILIISSAIVFLFVYPIIFKKGSIRTFGKK